MNAHSPASLSEDGGDSRKASARPPSDPHRACKVCGDKANGYNFGVLTCESCKAFFRRNAAKEHEISCPFSNACGITPASRRYCQACRLQKCFAVGMSRDWMQEQKTKPETKKRAKREEIEADSNSEEEVSVSKAYLKELMRKAKGRPTSCECTCSCGYYPPGTSFSSLISPLIRPTVTPQLPLVPLPTEPNLQPRFVQLPSDPSALFSLPSSSLGLSSAALSSPGPSAFSPLAISQGPMSCDSQILSPAAMDQKMASENYARLLQMSRGAPRLSSDEAELVQELVRVAQPLNNPLDMAMGDSAQMSLFDVVRITEYALRRIVCMARELSAFKILPIEDRKALIKGSASELLILRGVMAFDVHRNVWFHSVTQGFGPAMEVKLEVLKGTAASPQHYEEHKRFLESFDDRVRKKEVVILVLMAILIFQPERPSLVCVETVSNTQNKYLGLLRRLLAVEFGEIEAPSMYTRLETNLRELRQVNQSLVRIYYGFDQRQLDPLIKELFDM